MRQIKTVLKKGLIALFCIQLSLSFNVVSLANSDGNKSTNKTSTTKSKRDFSTYFGGNGEDRGAGVAIDKEGNQYLIGTTNSFRLTDNVVSFGSYNGGTDAFVARINSQTNELDYLAYLGGIGDDEATGIAVDDDGNVVVTGFTDSRDFPTTNGSLLSNAPNGTNAFVAKLNAKGTKWIYSTYLGGNADDEGFAVALDSNGNAYIAGVTDSFDFPTVNALQNVKNVGSDIFLARLNADGTALSYSTYIGGNNTDWALGVAVNSDGNVFLTGTTVSTNFPTTPNATQISQSGVTDGFVLQIDTNRTGADSLRFGTYLGGGKTDTGFGIALDSTDTVYVTGITHSPNFPVRNGRFQSTLKGESDVFVAKLNTDDGSLIYSTLLGGANTDYGLCITVDGDGNAVIAGFTESANFPLTNRPLQKNLAGQSDAFLFKLNNTGSALLYSTYIGSSSDNVAYGLALDSKGDAFITGTSNGNGFPVSNDAIQPRNGGFGDAFIFKVSLSEK
jgi:hypothetical protein